MDSSLTRRALMRNRFTCYRDWFFGIPLSTWVGAACESELFRVEYCQSSNALIGEYDDFFDDEGSARDGDSAN